MREPYEYPNLLTVLPRGWVEQCAAEEDADIRHIGRYLTFRYACPKCGPQLVQLTPDYPYCGPNSVWTCSHCASVMKLESTTPFTGTAKNCDTTAIRRPASEG
jgi:ribosomal protein L37AE/L43A